MSEPKLISPLLDNFDMGDPISQHDGIRCCPAMKKESDEKYIVKIISIPASQVQLDALLLTGAYPNAEAANNYFKDLSINVCEEAQFLQKLSNLEGFLAYTSWQTVPMENKTGYDVYLLGDYRRTLEQYLRKNSMTHLGAINLGLDLCAALAVCRHAGYLYVDLKPSNICLLDNNTYRIFDLGFFKLDTLKYASLPDKYRSKYTAPEITDAFSTLNTTIDVYAVGLILYQIFNDGQLPFTGEFAPAEIFQPPAYADYEMSEIILKACAPNPADRWQDPIEMGHAIVGYMQRNGANDTPIIFIPEDTSTNPTNHDTATEVVSVTSVEDEAPVDTDTDHLPLDLSSHSTFDDVFDESTDLTFATAESINAEVPDDAISIPDDTVQLPTDQLAVVIDSVAEDSNTYSTELADTAPANNQDNEKIYLDDGFGNLTFLIDDETLPGADISDIPYHEVSDEVSEILTHADELISHPTPDPVIPPEAIEVFIPEPILEDPSSDSVLDADNADPLPDQITCDDLQKNHDEPEQIADAAVTEEYEESIDLDSLPKPKKSFRPWINGILCLVLVLALCSAGLYYYQNYYLQPISIDVNGSDDTLTVYVSANIDDQKLTVLCSDTYGNSLTRPVADGKAVFENLAPGSGYTVSVQVSGFHKLTGEVSTAYSTPVQTNVVQFNAITGSEDGSVILSFTIDGPDTQQWTVRYSASGEEEKTVDFSGHMVTLSGLTVGKEYTFTLESMNGVYISGNHQIQWVAQKAIYADNLEIASCVDNKLTATWTVPGDAAVESWTVRCYNNKGFDQSIEATECSASIEIPDHTSGYTVEVTAENMSVGKRTSITENAVTVLGYSVDNSDPSKLVLSWETNYPLAEGAWLLLYSIDDSDMNQVAGTSENSVVIEPVLPDASYAFTIITSTGSFVFNNTYAYKTNPAPIFRNYNVSADYMEFNMCKTPDVENWDRFDLTSADYKTTYTVGEKASFLVRMRHEYNTSSDLIVATFLIRDNTGKIVNFSTSEQTWISMWYKNYCELDIPTMPDAAGNYTITVYFNGYFAGEQEFSVITA